jgi:hypothetical protein
MSSIYEKSWVELPAWQKDQLKFGLLSLKIKIKSLIVESRMIRSFEKRCDLKGVEGVAITDRQRYEKHKYDSLRGHRITVVRRQLRLSHLAMGYLKGRFYSDLEAKNERGAWAERLDKDFRKELVNCIERFGFKIGLNLIARVELDNYVLKWLNGEQSAMVNTYPHMNRPRTPA